MTEQDNTPDEIDVAFWTEVVSLSEIAQPTGVQFAFLSPDNKQCHQWIKCRDFLNDAFRGHVTKSIASIYGFTYDPARNHALSMEKMRILIKHVTTKITENLVEETKNSIKEMEETVNSGLSIVRLVEEIGNIRPLSKIVRIAGQKDVYLFEGACDWMESTFMISLYTLLIRLGARKIMPKDKEDLEERLKKDSNHTTSFNHDLDYIKQVLPFIHKIVEHRKTLRYIKEDGSAFLEKASINLFHNYTGAVALCTEWKNKNMDGLQELVALSERIRNNATNNGEPKPC